MDLGNSDSDLYVGKVISGLCVDLDHTGNGIIRASNGIIVAPGLLPGETAQVELVYKKSSLWVSRILDIENFSDYRRTPKCQVFDICGGCSIQHLDENEQLKLKHRHLSETIKRIGFIDIVVNSFPIHSNYYKYRNKTIIPMKRSSNGNVSIGYFRRGTHDIVDINSCPILDDRLSLLISVIKEDLDSTDIPIDCDQKSAIGLKHLVIRQSFSTNETLITLVAAHSNILGIQKLARKWTNNHTNIVGVSLNIQPNKSNKILGDSEVCLTGRNYIIEVFLDLKFLIFSNTFFQINYIPATNAVSRIIKCLKELNVKSVVDCYCGIGTIALPLANNGLEVLGIESNHISIKSARDNALINNIDNVKFKTGLVSNILSEYIDLYEAVVVDPPRKGLDSNTLRLLCNKPTNVLIYLSCNPSTLARDLKVLVTDNLIYSLLEITPYDFFPQTSHVESLAILIKSH